MRLDNIIVTALGVAGAVIAVYISWRGRRLPTTVTPLQVFATPKLAAVDATRVLAASLWAGLAAGFLVPGLVGRLLMRVLGATSGDPAQGRLTEAHEVVGEVTAGGTLSVILFVGLFGGVLSALLHLCIRRLLPGRAWVSGLVFGGVLLASFGVRDPLASDNVDFEILRPLPLAVALIVATALLFGTTFAAIASRTEQALQRERTSRLPHPAYATFAVFIVIPVLVASGLYVFFRAAWHGRLGVLLERPMLERAGKVIVVAAAALAVVLVSVTVNRIVRA